MTFPKDKDGLIYVRQSSLVQQQNNIHSFEMQTDKFLAYFREMGCSGHIEIVADDEALSGTLDIHKRKGMTKTVKWIEQERVGWIAAVHVNRFTRDPWLITPAVLMKKCYEHHIWVATLRMNFNFEDEYCQRVFMLEAEESARHLKWMKLILGGGKQIASDHGYYDGRFIVPGYIVDRTDPKRKKYMIYPPHADIVFWLFKRFFDLDGNFPSLKREVEAMPYLFPPFEEWVDRKNVNRFMIKEIEEGAYKGFYKPTKRGLESILCNPVYIGWWIPIDGGLVEDNHEPIIEDWLFTYAHKRLSTYDLAGERQKPARVIRNGKVQALLKKVIQDETGHAIYPTPDHGGTYRCSQYNDLSIKYKFSVLIRSIDEPFLERLFEKLRTWQGCEDWEDKIEQIQQNRESVTKSIREQIEQARKQWQESMSTLKNPNIRKTEQMKIDLANTCADLEFKIATLEKDLNPTDEEKLEDEEIQYQIYTLLPDLLDEWHNLKYETRLRFVGALVRKFIVNHVAPGWLKIVIEWKIADWGIDEGYLRRETNRTLWTPKEDAVIREFYPGTDAAIILEQLPTRSWQGIGSRAFVIGVKRNSKNGHQNSIHVNDPVIASSSIEDMQFAEEQGLDLSVKNVQWVTTSDSHPKPPERHCHRTQTAL